MDLLSALSELEKNKVGTGSACSAGVFLNSLQSKEQEAFINALENRTVNIPQLHELLKKNGYEVAERSLYRHRRKQCRCFNEKQ